jgi:hypothetical protein
MLRWFEQREGESCDACTVLNGELRLAGMMVKESTKEFHSLQYLVRAKVGGKMASRKTIRDRDLGIPYLFIFTAAIHEGFNTNAYRYTCS